MKRDKVAHLLYSAFGSGFLSVVLIFAFSERLLGAMMGFFVMFLIGGYKELFHDKIQGKGAFEWGDLLSDMGGSVAGAVLVYFLYS